MHQLHSQQCLICSDAPDWGENDTNDPDIAPQLKTIRLSLEEAIPCIAPLELLLATPTELRKGSDRANSNNLPDLMKPEGRTMSTMPDPFEMPLSNKRCAPGLFFYDVCVATYPHARANKRLVLALSTSEPDDHAYTAIVAPLDQCKTMARISLPALNAMLNFVRSLILAANQEAEGVPEDERIEINHGHNVLNVELGQGEPNDYADHVCYRRELWPNETWKITHRKVPATKTPAESEEAGSRSSSEEKQEPKAGQARPKSSPRRSQRLNFDDRTPS